MDYFNFAGVAVDGFVGTRRHLVPVEIRLLDPLVAHQAPHSAAVLVSVFHLFVDCVASDCLVANLSDSNFTEGALITAFTSPLLDALVAKPVLTTVNLHSLLKI